MQEVASTLVSGNFQDNGWHIGTARSFGQIVASAARAGLISVPNYASGPTAATLRPNSGETARPGSLSSKTGKGAQPMHTDGAHLRRVPAYVLLWSDSVNATATRLWRPTVGPKQTVQGIFVVSSGNDRFLAPAARAIVTVKAPAGARLPLWQDVLSGLRFDPTCMTPADDDARLLAEHLTSPPDCEVRDVNWSQPNQYLLIDNRRVLHGRAAVEDGDDARELLRANFVKKSGVQL